MLKREYRRADFGRKPVLHRNPHADIIFVPPGTSGSRIYIVKFHRKGKHPIVVKRANTRGYLKHWESPSLEFMKKRFKEGEQIPKPIRHFPFPEEHWKDRYEGEAIVESYEGIDLVMLKRQAKAPSEREVVDEIYKRFQKEHPNLAGDYLDTGMRNVVVNPKTGKVKRIDITGYHF